MTFDAIVIGSGPNGLAAAIELARNGCSVCLFEADRNIGGGLRSAEWTLPGFIHDTCSAVHPLGFGSPFFKQLPLDLHGLNWVFPDAPLAHPLGGDSAVMLEQSLADTSVNLGPDGVRWSRLFFPFIRNWDQLAADVLAPVHFPNSPLLLARFGRHAIRSAAGLAAGQFTSREARALFAGLAAHSILPLNLAGTAAFGLMLGVLGHITGWPLVRGGSQKLADALVSYFNSLGGKVVAGTRVQSLDDLPAAKAILCDVTPRQLLSIAGSKLPSSYAQKLARFRYGPGVFKMDWALRQPIPWKAAGCARAATVHIGGTLEEIVEGEAAVAEGKVPSRPFVLLAQPTLFDSTRAPAGSHTAWAYCHVPSGCTVDMTERIESQIEHVAPGFRDCILSRHTMNPGQMESYNPNYVGGDITGGAADLMQMIRRPVISRSPYTTPVRGLFICSSSTPPGGGVHGMCGYHAARAALQICL